VSILIHINIFLRSSRSILKPEELNSKHKSKRALAANFHSLRCKLRASQTTCGIRPHSCPTRYATPAVISRNSTILWRVHPQSGAPWSA